MTRFTHKWLACLALLLSTSSIAAVETFEIEGLITPASPEALTTELEAQLGVKVVNLDLKNSLTGWPLLSVEYDDSKLSSDDIKAAIAKIEDPAGHNYKVHEGPMLIRAPLLEEETMAIAKFGPVAPPIETVTNPMEGDADSINRGKALYDRNCTTCHGLSGNGQGPAAHGIGTYPRELYVWNNAPTSADGYLYWFITNGRNEMPPWGLVLSENERWDLINYIKTMTKPE